ncbi:MAG: tetratricopeptide repeat protein [Pirellulaceae bacterium]|nr:tetratricopeptide repeat protein [Pirellulaceae bacterium]
MPSRLVDRLVYRAPRLAAVGAVLLLCVTPLLETPAHAQDDAQNGAPPVLEQTQAAAPATDDKPKIDPGQGDLDEAVIARIDADTMKELEAVGALLESALAKGLSDENESFAKKMLGSVLLQRSQSLAGEMMRSRGRAQAKLRDEAFEVLQDAVKYDPTLVEAYLLIARLNLLPDGDKDAITAATSKAIELLADRPTEQSQAYVLRSLTYDDDQDEERMADLNAAVKTDPENMEARQARAALRLRQKDVDGAIEDLESILAEDPTNQRVAETAVRQLVEMNRVEAALSLITKTLEAKPSEGLYRMRAILYRMEGKEEEALADLNKALAMQPRDPMSLLQRAEIALSRKDVKSAKDDLRAATRLAPQLEQVDQAVFVRCLIAIEEGRMADAINDMQLLVDRDPENVVRQIQLANLYLSDDRPRKAIEVLSNVLDRDPKNVSVLRSRGDALLAVGEHKEAIVDYERAIKSADESDEDEEFDLTGILNNFAWVLATSPDDSLRNGKRAVELAERAVELSEEKEAHILSTLAAAYAETGDFEKAIQWSKKCVEMGRDEEHEQISQLEDELKSYEAGKPWREKTETEENAVPIISSDDLIDT